MKGKTKYLKFSSEYNGIAGGDLQILYLLPFFDSRGPIFLPGPFLLRVSEPNVGHRRITRPGVSGRRGAGLSVLGNS